MEKKQTNLTNVLLSVIIGLLICIFVYLVSSSKAEAPFMIDGNNSGERFSAESQSATPDIQQ